MNIIDNIIIPAPGCVLRRKADGLIRRGATELMYTFRIGNKEFTEGVLEKPEDYEDGIIFNLDGEIAVPASITNSYDNLVSELIHHKYSVDAEIALLNNFYINGESDEFNEYQSWRTKCKEVAKNYINENEEVK